jgi:hypothetical protein
MSKTYSLLSASLLLLLGAFFFITCAREYSYEGGNGSAAYTLVGAPGDCTGAIPMGTYYKGVAAGPADTIQLQAHVTKTGTYNLSTNSADGIRFSGTGSFIDTGFQLITLKASGTPSSEGSFVFTASIISGCSFTVVVSKAPVIMAGFTLAGAPNNCASPFINGSYVAGITLTSANTAIVQVTVTSVGPYTLKTDTIDGISFSKSGTFTTTGNQNVTLVATGTPETPANISFALSGAASDCRLNLAVVNPEPLATYVLESGLNICTHTVSGTYTSNTPLNSSNTVSVRVYVTVLGNFTISTAPLNGMVFTYTGSFTTLGAQNVILKGSGTPVSAGTFTFTPKIVGPHPIGGETCDFDITVL